LANNLITGEKLYNGRLIDHFPAIKMLKEANTYQCGELRFNIYYISYSYKLGRFKMATTFRYTWSLQNAIYGRSNLTDSRNSKIVKCIQTMKNSFSGIFTRHCNATKNLVSIDINYQNTIHLSFTNKARLKV
jgi:hypothetical protein